MTILTKSQPTVKKEEIAKDPEAVSVKYDSPKLPCDA